MIRRTVFVGMIFLQGLSCFAQSTFAPSANRYPAIYSGIPWYDQQGNILSAHGAGILQEGNTFYLFGEKHSDTSNAFAGFNCYSSKDLCNWTFESLALPVQPSGKLGPNRVGERVKPLKCPATGQYLLFMHVDTLGYNDPFVGYAIADKMTGPYRFQGPILFDGKPIRKWDMGVFQDLDGSGYILLHGGDIYQLNDDYRSISKQVCKAFEKGLEAPTVLRHDSTYFFLGSHLTSWEKNDNYYYTASSLNGPWIRQAPFAPEGTLTWNSQTTFVLPIGPAHQPGFLFMGDRWSFPKQASAATYIWQALQVEGNRLSIPEFNPSLKVDIKTGLIRPYKNKRERSIDSHDSQQISYSGNWQTDASGQQVSEEKNASYRCTFKGTGIEVYGLMRPDGGYAQILLQNSKGEKVLDAIIDTYCSYSVSGLRFRSPVLNKDQYTIIVTVLHERGNWSDKRRAIYGSTGYHISLEKLVVNP